MLLPVLLGILAVAWGATPPGTVDVFVMDCNQKIHLAPSLIASTVDLAPLIRAYYAQNYQRTVDAIRCHCPGLSQPQIDEYFAPTLSNLLRAWQNPLHQADLDAIVSAQGCTPFTHDYANFNQTVFGLSPTTLPSTCNYATYPSDGCLFSYKLPNRYGFATVNVAIRECGTDPTAAPFVSVTCFGPNCETFFEPCFNSDDCSGTGALGQQGVCIPLVNFATWDQWNLETLSVPQTLSAYFDILGVYPDNSTSETNARCFNVQTPYAAPLTVSESPVTGDLTLLQRSIGEIALEAGASFVRQTYYNIAGQAYSGHANLLAFCDIIPVVDRLLENGSKRNYTYATTLAGVPINMTVDNLASIAYLDIFFPPTTPPPFTIPFINYYSIFTAANALLAHQTTIASQVLDQYVALVSAKFDIIDVAQSIVTNYLPQAIQYCKAHYPNSFDCERLSVLELTLYCEQQVEQTNLTYCYSQNVSTLAKCECDLMMRGVDFISNSVCASVLSNDTTISQCQAGAQSQYVDLIDSTATPSVWRWSIDACVASDSVDQVHYVGPHPACAALHEHDRLEACRCSFAFALMLQHAPMAPDASPALRFDGIVENVPPAFNQTLREMWLGDCVLTNTSLSCPHNAILPWDGAMSIAGAPAGVFSTSRMQGTAFPQPFFVSPPSAADTIATTVDQASMTLLSLECDGTVSLLPSTHSSMSLGAAFVTRAFDEVASGMLEPLFKCRYSDPIQYSAFSFQAEFDPFSPAFWLNMFTAAHPPAQVGNTPSPTLFEGLSRLWYGQMDGSPLRVNMPSTCSLLHWLVKGECAFDFTALPQLLPGVDATLQVVLKTCSASPMGVPAIALTCKGASCESIFDPKHSLQFCSSAHPCANAQATCEPLHNLLAQFAASRPARTRADGVPRRNRPGAGFTGPGSFFWGALPNDTCSNIDHAVLSIIQFVQRTTGQQPLFTTVDATNGFCNSLNLTTLATQAASLLIPNSANNTLTVMGLSSYTAPTPNPNPNPNNNNGGSSTTTTVVVVIMVILAIVVVALVALWIRRRSRTPRVQFQDLGESLLHNDEDI